MEVAKTGVVLKIPKTSCKWWKRRWEGKDKGAGTRKGTSFQGALRAANEFDRESFCGFEDLRPALGSCFNQVLSI